MKTDAEEAHARAAAESFETARPAVLTQADRSAALSLGVAEASKMQNGTGPRAAASQGRELPHSIEAEKYHLSCCMMDGADVIPRSLEAGIRPESYYDTKNGIVYSTLLKLHVACQPTELANVAEELKASRQLDAIGGYAFLTQVSSQVPTTAQAGYFIEKVRDQALLREIIRTAVSVAEDCYRHVGDVGEFLERQEARLTPLLQPPQGSGPNAFTVWSPAQFRAWSPPMELNLLGAGYLRRRQITTLIGPPGVGKSRLSLWLAVSHIAGRSFAGLDPKGGTLNWLFFGNENDPERQKHDLDFFYRHLTTAEQTLVDDHLSLHVLETHDDRQLTLADPAVYARAVATLKARKPDIVIWDPWGNMIETNENDNEEVRRTLRYLLRAMNAGAPDAAILIIHHARTGKANTIEAGNNYSSGSLGRGSKVLVSQARCELALWAGDAEDSSKLVLTCEKVNNAPKFEPVGLLFDHGIYIPDPDFSLKAWRDDIDGKRSTKTLSTKQVIDYVKLGVVSAKHIIAHAESDHGVVRATVYARLKDAVAKGYLIANNAGIYAVAPQADPPAPTYRDITQSSFEPEPIQAPPDFEELP